MYGEGGLREIDYLIGMDQANIRNITQIAGGDPEKKIYKMLEFAGDGWKELKQESGTWTRCRMWRIRGIRGILMIPGGMWRPGVRDY